ncbi:MAG: hypothetical protein WBO46_07415 [Caldilineaceae bacterium]
MFRRLFPLSWSILFFLLIALFLTSPPRAAQAAPAAEPFQTDIRSTDALSSTLFLPTLFGTPALVVEMTPEERMVAIDAIGQVIDSVLPGVDTPTDQRDLAAEVEQLAVDVLALPQVVTTYVSTVTLTVNAVLTDGLTIAIVNNRPPESTVATTTAQSATLADTPQFAQMRQMLARQANATGLPGSDRAVSVAFDGGGAVAAQVGQLLTESGYNVLSLGASLEDMRNYNNLGALYLDTHGVSFMRVTGYTLNEQGYVVPTLAEGIYAIQTSSKIQGKLLSTPAIQEDLRQGRLAIAWVQEKNGWNAKIAITQRFINTYWNFSDGVVMLHACFSGAGPFNAYEQCKGSCQAGQPGVLDPTPFQQAIINANARLLVGFDNFTNADVGKKSILFFWDRLLGRNTQQPPTPPARPFDWSQVRQEMITRKLLTFRVPAYMLGPLGFGGNDVSLSFFFNNAPHAAAPSIKRLVVQDDATASQGEVELHGVFPATAGSVTVGSQPASIKSWGAEKIVINTPFGSNGATGAVLVKGPGDVKSNPVPLTEWIGTVTYSFTPGQSNLQAKSTLTARFRADLHPYRETLSSDPVQTPVTTYLSGASTGFSNGSGSYSENGVTYAWSPGGEMDLYGKIAIDSFASIPTVRTAAHASASGGIYGGRVTLDGDKRSGELCLALQGHYQQTITGDGQTYTLPSLILLPGPDGLADRRLGFLDCFSLTMNSDYSLAAGNRQVAVEGAIFRVQWSRFEPVNPPGADDPS